MENIPTVALVGGGITIIVVSTLLVWLYLRARRINLTQTASPNEKPEWMDSDPPPETIAATQSNTGGISLFGEEAGEHMAAPFAEQIEDILHARLRADSTLSALKVDLGSAPDGGLEIWVDGTRYTNINDVPNPRLREAFKQATQQWEQSQRS